MFTASLFLIRVLKGSIPLSAGLALLKAFAISFVLLLTSQIHSIVFYIKCNFMSLDPKIGSTILDFGWVRVNRTVSDFFMSEYIAHYSETQNGFVNEKQISDIIKSSGGSVDLARSKVANLINLASQMFNISSLSATVVQNSSVALNFVSTNPKFVALLSVMIMFGGLRLYHKGLVGLCPLHTFEDFTNLVGRLHSSFIGNVPEKKGNDDLIPGY
jgi:hypothetical protein